MLIDQARQPLDRQPPVPDRQQQFGRDRIALDPAMAGARQHVGPPLQAHFARQRLADLFAHPGNLDIEGVERQQRAALVRRHEQRGGVAGKIMGAHQVGAEIRRIACCRPRRSWHRDQRRRDAPPLADHDVVGADRRAGLHRIQHHPHRAQRLAKRRRRQPDVGAGADDQRIDAVRPRRTRASSDSLSISSGLRDRPGPDRIRQAQQRAAMRHVGEGEAALAVGLDRRRSRKMRSVRARPAIVTSSTACPARRPGWCRRRDRSGSARR